MAFRIPIRNAHFHRSRTSTYNIVRYPIYASNLNANSIARTCARTIMTSTTASLEKIDWLVILPDREGALEKRLEVRQSHLSAIEPHVESGFWKMGGAILGDVPREEEGLKFMGSVMIAHAATKEEVLEAINQDIYSKSNVWDLEKIQIHPFKTAFRKS